MPSPLYDETQFLEPAHYHDPTKISNVAGISHAFLGTLPAHGQKALCDIQESTSVAYASYRRLQDLSKERFHRLVPAKDQSGGFAAIEYSEPAFHSYINFLQTEKQYFMEEALVDWRHKAMRIYFGGLNSTKLCVEGNDTTFLQWWENLQNTVEHWVDEVEEINIPDFEETVQEYMVFQRKENRRNSAREERNRRKNTVVDLDRPELGERKPETVD